VGDDRERIGFQKKLIRQDWVNRRWMQTEEELPQTKTFAEGLEFLQTNHDQDNWFLQIETFDPHEPFYTTEEYADLYPSEYDGDHFDWPSYGPVTETKDEVECLRRNYRALLSMCDKNLGKILDFMDRKAMWDDTMLIVTTDHGFLLAEHDWWGKLVMPFYNEIAHIPLNIWDPRCGRAGVRAASLVQMIDFAPTLLRFFGVSVPDDMNGHDLGDTIAHDTAVREAALFGAHGGHVNCTDGRYIYMRAPVIRDNTPLYNYTLVPMHMRHRFRVAELQDLELAGPFSFTKGCQVLKIPAAGMAAIETNPYDFGTLLFDLESDPKQRQPIRDAHVEERMARLTAELMRRNDAPPDQYQRLGLE